jgi:hypothetical protein
MESSRSQRKRKQTEDSGPSKKARPAPIVLPTRVISSILLFVDSIKDLVRFAAVDHRWRDACRTFAPMEKSNLHTQLAFREFAFHKPDPEMDQGMHKGRKKFFRSSFLRDKVNLVQLNDRDAADGRPFFPNATVFHMMHAVVERRLPPSKTFGNLYHSIVDPAKLTRIEFRGGEDSPSVLFGAEDVYPNVAEMDFIDLSIVSIPSMARQFPSLRRLKLYQIWNGRRNVVLDKPLEHLQCAFGSFASILPTETGRIHLLQENCGTPRDIDLDPSWKTLQIDVLMCGESEHFPFLLRAGMHPTRLALGSFPYAWADDLEGHVSRVLPSNLDLFGTLSGVKMYMEMDDDGERRARDRSNTFAMPPALVQHLHDSVLVLYRRGDPIHNLVEVPILVETESFLAPWADIEDWERLVQKEHPEWIMARVSARV